MWQERDTALAVPAITEVFDQQDILTAQQEWQRRLSACPAEHRPYLIMQYAMPLENQYRSMTPNA